MQTTIQYLAVILLIATTARAEVLVGGNLLDDGVTGLRTLADLRILTSLWSKWWSLVWPGPVARPIGNVVQEPPSTLTFGYGPLDGPATWANNFPLCGDQRQSPVDLQTSLFQRIVGTPPLRWTTSYRQTPISLRLRNNGKALEVNGDWGPNPAPELTGGPLQGGYTFLQMHFHWGADNTRGSEHTVDGRSYPLELHVVHYKTEYGTPTNALNYNDGLAVVGYFFQLSLKPSAIVDTLLPGFSTVRNPETNVEITPLPLSALVSPPGSVVSYLGALTTPPCVEGVIWLVSDTVLSVTRDQLAAFRSLIAVGGKPMVDNFRPPLPLYGRSLYLYK